MLYATNTNRPNSSFGRNILIKLKAGLQHLNLDLSPDIQQKLIDYVLLLHKWNKTYNLTAIREPQAIVIRHILDSLAIAPYIHGNRILDVGTGAGLPGIPLALAFPKKHFVLLDSNNKKIRFLTHAVTTLKINNTEVIQQRIEDFHPGTKFDIIITRAFASLKNIIEKTRHLFSEEGCLLAMKGKYPKKELQEIRENVIVHNINVPYLNEQRHLVCIKRVCRDK